ncbi:MAG TPA: MFS transporter [Candidatus Limnocylindrales bacterium]
MATTEPEAGGRIAGDTGPMITARSAMTFVVLLGSVSLFSDATYEGGRSLVGQFLQLLGSSAAAVGIAVGAGEFLGYALRLVSGYAADRTGAYWRITLLGYGINLLAMPLLAFVGRWEIAIALLFIERIGKAIRNPARDAMLSYATKEMGRGWGYGLHEAMDQIGAFVGPLSVSLALFLRGAGNAGLADYQAAFVILFVPAVIAVSLLLLARRLFPHPRDLESKTPRISAEGLGRTYWLFVIAAGFIAAGYADFALMAFHFHAIELVSDEVIPLLFAVGMAVDAGAALVMGRLYDRSGFAVLIVAVALGAIFAPFIYFGSLPIVVVGIALWGIGLSAQESILKAALAGIIPHERRAYGFGLFATVFGIFWFVGSATMGLLYDIEVGFLVAFSVVSQLLALPIFLVTRRRLAAGEA